MRILVLQHLAVEHPGVFRDLWSADGHISEAVELDEGASIPPLEDYDVMVVMGGPMDVWEEQAHPWLAAEKSAIRRWVRDLERPYLGICLGHQLLAAALGGTVGPMKSPEVGLARVELTPGAGVDPLLKGLPRFIETFQWHGAEVVRMPVGSEILAGNEACAVQAMRVGHRAYGFQFHCEITKTTVADWSAIPAYVKSLERALGRDSASRLGDDVASRLPTFADTARLLNENMMRIATVKE